MKKTLIKFVSVLSVLVFLLGAALNVCAAQTDRSYSDVKYGDWYYDAVDFDTALGIINGVGNGQFAPKTTLSRAMAITMLYRLEGSPDVPETGNPFTDVRAGCYYENAVKWGVSNKIVFGVSQDQFAPDQSVTREQLACFMIRYAESIHAEFLENGDYYVEQAFDDRASTSAYALDAMTRSVSLGLFRGSGDGMMYPRSVATRAEIAVVFCRMAVLLQRLPDVGTVTVGSGDTAIPIGTEEALWFFQGLTQRSSWKETEPFGFTPDYRLNLWGTEYLFSKDSTIPGCNCVAPDGTVHGMQCVVQVPERQMRIILRKLSECQQ